MGKIYRGAVASWIAGILLAEIGFNSKTMLDAVTTPSTIQTGIAIIFFIGPVVLIALALILSRSFKLNRQTHEILKNEISRLEQGGSKKDVSPEARLVTEELTGHPYETLWPEKRIL